MSQSLLESFLSKNLKEAKDLESTAKQPISDMLEAMSDEDRHDSEIIRSIIDKTRVRTNASLTKEEKEILAKYNLRRFNNEVRVAGLKDPRGYSPTVEAGGSDSDISNPRGGYQRERRSSYRYKNDPSEVNYADMARKRIERAQARYDYYNQNPVAEMQARRDDLERAIHSRDYNQRQIDAADEKYQKALEDAKKAYIRAIEVAESSRDSIDRYNVPNLEKAIAEIDKILRR